MTRQVCLPGVESKVKVMRKPSATWSFIHGGHAVVEERLSGLHDALSVRIKYIIRLSAQEWTKGFDKWNQPPRNCGRTR